MRAGAPRRAFVLLRRRNASSCFAASPGSGRRCLERRDASPRAFAPSRVRAPRDASCAKVTHRRDLHPWTRPTPRRRICLRGARSPSESLTRGCATSGIAGGGCDLAAIRCGVIRRARVCAAASTRGCDRASARGSEDGRRVRRHGSRRRSSTAYAAFADAANCCAFRRGWRQRIDAMPGRSPPTCWRCAPSSCSLRPTEGRVPGGDFPNVALAPPSSPPSAIAAARAPGAAARRPAWIRAKFTFTRSPPPPRRIPDAACASCSATAAPTTASDDGDAPPPPSRSPRCARCRRGHCIAHLSPRLRVGCFEARAAVASSMAKVEDTLEQMSLVMVYNGLATRTRTKRRASWPGPIVTGVFGRQTHPARRYR